MGNARNIAFWIVLFLLILALFNLFSGNQSTMSSRTLSYSDFIARVDSGDVQSVTLDGELAARRCYLVVNRAKNPKRNPSMTILPK